MNILYKTKCSAYQCVNVQSVHFYCQAKATVKSPNPKTWKDPMLTSQHIWPRVCYRAGRGERGGDSQWHCFCVGGLQSYPPCSESLPSGTVELCSGAVVSCRFLEKPPVNHVHLIHSYCMQAAYSKFIVYSHCAGNLQSL